MVLPSRFKKKNVYQRVIFLGIYFIYFFTLSRCIRVMEKVWNLKVVSGILIFGIPMEELLFAISFLVLSGRVFMSILLGKIN